ncbi:MAG: hypothetical protein PWQ12_1795 [Clostridiales bacterium]|jgi:glycosyltransferase involved in cell wall biosynthesis|nr:hypothetical protein [Clostridiales bacterium]
MDSISEKGLSIVVPCYNERENIPLILERFEKTLGDRPIEVVLVDNGSTDGSDEVLKALLPAYPFASSVRVPVNQGYGYGIVFGLRAARGHYIGWTHADMQTDPADISKAYDRLKSAGFPDWYFKGKRKGRPLFDRFFTVGMSAFETVYLGAFLWDINAQPNLFPASFFNGLQDFPDDFSLDLYMYYQAKRIGLPVRRFEVRFTERIHGASKWNDNTMAAKKKFILRTLDFSRRMKKNLGGNK